MTPLLGPIAFSVSMGMVSLGNFITGGLGLSGEVFYLLALFKSLCLVVRGVYCGFGGGGEVGNAWLLFFGTGAELRRGYGFVWRAIRCSRCE